LVVTESGFETNIGQDCGRTHFGEEVFSSARSDYQKRRDRADLLNRARALQAAAPAIDAQIKDFAWRPFGGKWTRKVESELGGLLGQPLVDSLGIASLRGELEVRQSRRRSDDEIEELMALSRGATRDSVTYASEMLGTLEPMPWIGFDFRQKLMVELLEPLKAFGLIDLEQVPTPKLRSALKQFDGHEKLLKDAVSAADSALRFLAEDNLRLVALWLPEHHRREADRLRNWIGNNAHKALVSGRTT
jgi:hypothetical protein